MGAFRIAFNRILLLPFTCSMYCSFPKKVHTVACSMQTIGIYYSIRIVHIKLRLWCFFICLWSWRKSFVCYINIFTVHRSCKTYVLLTNICAPNVMYVLYFQLCRELWARMARKACWLAHCKIRLDFVEHPGTSGIFTFHILRPGSHWIFFWPIVG